MDAPLGSVHVGAQFCAVVCCRASTVRTAHRPDLDSAHVQHQLLGCCGKFFLQLQSLRFKRDLSSRRPAPASPCTRLRSVGFWTASLALPCLALAAGTKPLTNRRRKSEAGFVGEGKPPLKPTLVASAISRQLGAKVRLAGNRLVTAPGNQRGRGADSAGVGGAPRLWRRLPARLWSGFVA